jgi:predicted  nucleic acid-binding Zn-ribbon protein
VAGLTTRLEKLQNDLVAIETTIKDKKNAIDNHQVSIKKYSEQQKDVRNNREFNALTKEVEFQELEIQLAEKQIKELKANSEHKKEVITGSKDRLEQKSNHLKHKKTELNDIMSETEKEETFLSQKSSEFESKIEARLLAAYKRIRGSVRNGLAVVSIERGASAGSFFTIPPQIQVEIASRKKIITDEHSGRILVDAGLAEEEREKMEKIFSKM